LRQSRDDDVVRLLLRRGVERRILVYGVSPFTSPGGYTFSKWPLPCSTGSVMGSSSSVFFSPSTVRGRSFSRSVAAASIETRGPSGILTLTQWVSGSRAKPHQVTLRPTTTLPSLGVASDVLGCDLSRQRRGGQGGVSDLFYRSVGAVLRAVDDLAAS
jgi:hypothetical protein